MPGTWIRGTHPNKEEDLRPRSRLFGNSAEFCRARCDEAPKPTEFRSYGRFPLGGARVERDGCAPHLAPWRTPCRVRRRVRLWDLRASALRRWRRFNVFATHARVGGGREM